MKSYLSELNDVQRVAVTNTEGPVLVVAGPGSGKTRVLTYRIAHLIEEGVAPWEILTLTFTNKAAKEMKERISKVVGNKADRVWAGTFHSIFAKILRVEADKIGYKSNFTIYDSDDSKSLIGTIVKEMNLDKTVYNVNAIRARISSAKSNIIPPRAYKDNEELMQQDLLAKRPLTHAIYEKYVARCKKAGAMDFDDLLYQLYVLWYKNPDNVIEKYRKKFKYVLVDEFQDTNYLQYSILKKLVMYPGSPENICAVGDDAQSIYAFRGATIENILDFEKDFKNLKTFKLEQNYRSTDHIVQAANEVISHNKRQIQKKIWSDEGTGQKIKVIKAMSDNEEGKRVVDTIVEQKNRNHLKNAEIAILYRTNSQSRVFEEYLRRYNLTYRVYGGLSFYQRKEVKDLIAYLRLTINPNDEEALRRIINYPRRAIGNSTIEKISELANATNQSMWDCLPDVTLSARAKNAVLDFLAMMKVFMQKAEKGNAYEVASYIAKQSKLLDALKSDTTIEGMNRLENVNALLDGIKDFVENDEEREGEATADKSLASYLQNIALLTDFDDESKASGDYVTLMSVHSAKGLEFKSIFVVGMEENLFPSFMSMDTKEGIDEERRLFYVAITRAERFLTLSFADNRYQYGKMRNNEPSRFLEEVSEEHLESSFSMRRGTEVSTGSSGGAKVTGNFTNQRTTINTSFKVDPATFKPNPSSEIQTGMKVLHLKFGEGKVLSIDGAETNRVATIFFKGVDSPQRRIMLKFAKLQIL
ncbi:MAG: DNA helicase-2/ATP-dependent DNA helicase PcrA [Saprospiraceae bacterium]|jgi:DNA helicase-2/ATP-dependent DNA helicase PcrA